LKKLGQKTTQAFNWP